MYAFGVPRLYVETDATEPCPADFGGPTDVLVYFLSLAFSTRYGSIHPLSQLALMLRLEKKIDMKPITTFADRDIEEESDAREMERAWQDAAPLAASLTAVNAELASPDERIRELTADFPDLHDRLADLQRIAEWAAGRGARIRMSFEL